MAYLRNRYFKSKNLPSGEFANALRAVIGRYTQNPDSAHLDFVQWLDDGSSQSKEYAKYEHLYAIQDLGSHFKLRIWSHEFKIDATSSRFDEIYIGFTGAEDYIEISVQADNSDYAERIFNAVISELKLEETKSPTQVALTVAERQPSPTSLATTKSLSSELHITWGPLRAILENNFTFSNIKEIIGLAGLDLTTLSHLQQQQGSATSKGHLMTAIDGLLGNMPENEKRRFITIVTEEVLHRRPNTADRLKDYLSRLGWAVYDGTIIPLEILDLSELPELPAEARPDLAKAAQRLRDGDLSGAISAACGAVDATTSRIYSEKSLGDPGSASFQERVVNSLRAHGVLTHLDADLQALGWDVKEIKPFKENLAKSLNQAAYVMQILRANMGDVHGSKPILKPLVFDAIKWASLIIRLLA